MKTFIETFDHAFRRLHENSRRIVENIPQQDLFRQPVERNALFPINSCGEYVLRSAGAVEQTFGGITVKLWDDPFEWTLPEALSTNELILDYLEEVEATRRRGFALFRTDEDLRRELPAPEKLKTLFALLVETLARAENLQGRAAAIARLLEAENGRK